MLDHMTRRPRQRRLRARLPAPLGRHHGAADARHPRRPAAPARRRSTRPTAPRSKSASSIIKRAWTEDLLSYDGRYWRVPPGPTPWTHRGHAPLRRRRRGRHRAARSASCPSRVQKPHPPLFQPFASSERSIRWCAQEGVTAILPPLHPKLERACSSVYAEESGRPLGDGIGVLRDVVVADYRRGGDGAVVATAAPSAAPAWFEPFGFAQGMVDPGQAARAPICSIDEPRTGRIGRHRDAPARAPARPPAGALAVFAWTLQRVDPARRSDALGSSASPAPCCRALAARDKKLAPPPCARGTLRPQQGETDEEHGHRWLCHRFRCAQCRPVRA